MALQEGRATVNGVDVAYLHCGSGPLALCLHGFPDSAHTWRHLLPLLADAGFHAVAPFLRGYAPSAVPADGQYHPLALGADAVALHEALGGSEPGVLVGHDWGASAVYVASLLAPERFTRVVGMAVPPGGALGTSLVSNLDQLQRSWYFFFLAHPLADVVAGQGDLAFVDLLWAQWSPGFDATEELALLKPSLRDPANLAAAVGYYRAVFSPDVFSLDALRAGIVPTQPLLYLHGANDGCIGVEVARAAAGTLPATAVLEVVEGAGHFLHLEQPDQVNRRLLGFLAA